jgi:FAD dependent oxidoreductase/pyridine nucleotide-disulfide oxidoreductase
VDVESKTDRSTSADERARILQACRAMVPAVADMVPIRQFAGIRHVSSTGDFILRPSTAGDRIYLAAGIRSTGISTSPAVAEAIVEDVVRRRGWKASARRLEAPRMDLPQEPGEVVCVCRSISQAEVLAACRHPVAPKTLDAVKRRGGATFGDCQGNLCGLQIAGMIAEEQGVPLALVEKHLRGSWLWEARATANGRRTPPGARSVLVRRAGATVGGPFDVVVIGAGRSGRAAAEAASHRGSRVAVVERRSNRAEALDPAVVQRVLEATVVALQPMGSGWSVLVQDRSGAIEVEASAVVVATGAYVEPREHRPIGGPRPAGVMTADLAESVLEAGLRPGRRAFVVGRGARADRLVGALLEAGTEVIRGEAPDEVAGERRLEAVRHGTDWLAADTLILADRLLAQTFLLRGLGLVDGRPGISAPVDETGHLPLPGLWAVGCCVRPSTDHRACGDAGRQIGERVSRSFAASGGLDGGLTQDTPDPAAGRGP